MMTLEVSTYPLDHDKAFPFFREPAIIGYFSLDGERKFSKDFSGLNYSFQRDPSSVSLDLDYNVDRAIKPLPEKENEKITNLLKGILAFKQKLSVEGELDSLHTDVVCFRGLLTVLLGTPYERRDGWIIEVVRWRGTLYLLQVETERRREERRRETRRQRQMSSWGYKFEQLMTSSVPGRLPDSETPVNENEEFCCLFRTRIGKVSVLYGAEMDSYQSDKILREDETLRPDKFLELKTSRIIETEKQDRNFKRFKLLKWWSQSFLVGTRQILCGWRDDDGRVTDLETFNVRDIPKTAVDWRPNCCANFLSSFLSLLVHRITKDDLQTVHRVEFVPGQDLQISSYRSDTEHILPSWYYKSIFLRPN